MTHLDYLSQPRTLTEIAKRMKTDKQEARAYVLRLIDEGLVVKRERVDFRSRCKYELSQAGRNKTASECRHSVNPETDRCVLCGRNRFNRTKAATQQN